MADLVVVDQLRLDAGPFARPLRLVDGVSFAIARGEAVGLVGESGAGKSLTAAALPRLLPSEVRIAGGRVLLDGQDLAVLPEKAMRGVRGRRIGYVGQDPAAALDPSMTVLAQVVEAVLAHPGADGAIPRRGPARAAAFELLAEVGLPEARERPGAYPHELSGGQRQRVVLAMALAGRPELLVADEPTSALDVTLQAQFLALLRQLRAQTGLALLLISHDLPLVAETCDRLIVMFAGTIVEDGGRDEILADPRHPYTQELIEATRAPLAGALAADLEAFGGRSVARGCRFRPRCPRAFERCADGDEPALFPRPEGGRVRCWLEAPGDDRGAR